MIRAERKTGADGTLRVFLSGVIDDTVDLTPIFTGLPSRVIIDLRGVTRMNSMGVRQWVDEFGRAAKTTHFIIEAVSYPMVMQAISVRYFFARAEIASCMAPYFCPRCSRAENVLVRRLEASTAQKGKYCGSCGEEMYFDELDQYFVIFETTP